MKKSPHEKVRKHVIVILNFFGLFRQLCVLFGSFFFILCALFLFFFPSPALQEFGL